jgi:transposase
MKLNAGNTQSTIDSSVIERLLSTITSLQSTAGQTAIKLKHAELKIQALTLELAHHKRLRFGVKSEALSSAQRELFAEDWSSDNAELELAVESLQTPPRAPRQNAGRQPLPETLPRIIHRHEPENCMCGQCGKDLTLIREDVSEQLDVEPARFFVHRHIRPQYACRACETVVAEPAPAALIDGGLAAPGLLTWLLINKYQDHLPLYRLEQIAARSGVNLARSTLADWAGRCGVAQHPLAERLAELLRQRKVIHGDETPIQQLDPGAGKTKRAYLWVYRSNDLDDGPPIAVFDYQSGRSGEHARHFLGEWRGHLVVDDYAGYKALFALGIREVGCWAHARRKFVDLHRANQHPTAAEALTCIGELYAIEADARELNGEQRQRLRQTAQTKLISFKIWLDETRLRTADGSALAKAIDYSLKRWPALSGCANTGNLPIDNNPVENTIRPIAIGKKNWLFAGSERAGKRAAAIQTLLATAKLNGIEPAAWLKDTLEKLPTWPNSRLDELLPIKQQG